MYSGHELLWYVQERHAVAVPSSGRTRTLPRRRRRRVYSILISVTVGVGRDLRRVCSESQSAKQWNPEGAPYGPGPGRARRTARNRFANRWNVGDSASRKGNYTHLDLLLELLLFFYNRTRIQMSLSKLYFYLYRICWVSCWSR